MFILLGMALFSAGKETLYMLHSTPKVSAKTTSDNIYSNTPVNNLLENTPSQSFHGLTKTIRYSADQEEDLINSAIISLPLSSDSKITAKAYIVKDLTTNTTAFEHNSDRLLPIASLTKLVTAEVARQLIPQDKDIVITKDAFNTYGNTAGFKVGETITARDLIYPLLMVSSNDAAEAYARSYGRSSFIQAMNNFVRNIGAYRTYFDDPSGLSANNVSTASDLALILNWIRVNDPEILKITLLKSQTVHYHTWTNPTHFLNWSYYLGGKNGYTDEANRTTAALFILGKNKDTYALIILGSETRDPDMIRLMNKIK